MQGEFIVAIIILIVVFNSEWKARRWAAEFKKETERQYEEGIDFYKRLKTASREELAQMREEEFGRGK